MAYWYLNKQTNKAEIFGSITALCKYTGLKKDNLYTKFGREGHLVFENDIHWIRKLEIKRGGK